ncbi:NADH-quinone oxidoreductase subunit NuoN [bacterium]|nr:NADH-quinone oxidoreductase subunit NuoN [bacterium]
MSMFDITILLPEIFLSIVAMLLLVAGAFSPGFKASQMCYLLLGSVAVAFAVAVEPGSLRVGEAFYGMVRVSEFTLVFKLLVMGASGLVLLMMAGHLKQEERSGRAIGFEMPILVVLATVGLMLMVSANDLIALYMGLELASLSMYVLASGDVKNLVSTEAGLKYFVLGAIASGFVLYGSSLVYGVSGTTSFAGIASFAKESGGASAMMVLGVVFIVAGLCFKVSAVPFHMWTPDVYQGSPTYITAFFATAPKVAALALFSRVLMEPFGSLAASWQQLLLFVAVASMIIGAVAAIRQRNIKRMLAFSSIGHVGYMLMALAVNTPAAYEAMVLYLLIYVAMSAAMFACMLSLKNASGYIESIDDMAGLSKSHFWHAFAISALMFSMAGIPPLAGFFAKFILFQAVVQAGYVWLAVVAVLCSVVGAYYYIRIVKLIWFDDAAVALSFVRSRSVQAVTLAGTALTCLYVFYPQPLIDAGHFAASALM